MKKILKVIAAILGVIATLAAITLTAWAGWQVMPDNPQQNEWAWNFPPFPLAIAVWMAGIALFIPFAFVGYILVTVGIGIFGKKPLTNEQQH